MSTNNEVVKLLEKRWSSCKYKPEYDQMLLDHLSKGLSFMSFDTPEGVAYSTLRKWCDRFPSFGQAREIGEKRRLQLLEKEGIKMVKGGNVVAWKFLMGEYGVVERSEVHVTSDSPHMQVPAGIRYARLQKLKELHQKVKMQEEQKALAQNTPKINEVELVRSEPIEDDFMEGL